VLALVVGLGVGLVSGGDSVVLRILHRHVPRMMISASPAVAGIPVASAFPKNLIWLWIPGSGYPLQKKLCQQFSAIRAVRLSRSFTSNTITVNVDPRVPLVTWNGAGFDCEGMLFAITPGTWKVMPQAVFLPTARKREIGHWLAALSNSTEIWTQILSIRQDASEAIALTLKTGTVVVWGPPDQIAFSDKARVLARILDDAHKNMGGAASADLRFFEQGRIIVRPKAVRA